MQNFLCCCSIAIDRDSLRTTRTDSAGALHDGLQGSKGVTKLLTGVKFIYAPAASARGGHRTFGLSVRAYVRPSVDQINIFVQGIISRPINGSKLIFHMKVYRY